MHILTAMRTWLATALLIAGFLSAPAEARMFEYDGPNGITYGFVMPPDRYRDMDFAGEIIVRNFPAKEVLESCSMIVKKQEGNGCALFTPSNCIIMINQDMPPDMYAATLEHEEAHCKGWPADHPVE